MRDEAKYMPTGRQTTAVEANTRRGIARAARTAGRWRCVDPAYSTVHARLRKQRGKASTHACTDCGGPAESWSYDGRDPAEKTGPRGLKYSADLAHYQARCHLCHVAYDRIAEKISTIRAAKLTDFAREPREDKP